MEGGDLSSIFAFFVFSICSINSAAVKGLFLLHDAATGTLLLCINHILYEYMLLFFQGLCMGGGDFVRIFKWRPFSISALCSNIVLCIRCV